MSVSSLQACLADENGIHSSSQGRVFRVIKILRMLKILRLLRAIKVVEIKKEGSLANVNVAIL